VRLSSEFVAGQMISLAMGNSSGGVGVRRKVVKFRDSFMRALGHRFLLRWAAIGEHQPSSTFLEKWLMLQRFTMPQLFNIAH